MKFMEIHVQRCQFCGSNKMKNILVRQPGDRDRVYVQCHDCEEFVASYIIAPRGYYHHGKGYESFFAYYDQERRNDEWPKIAKLF